MKKLSYQLASWPDEDVVVAEIYLGDKDIGHVARHGEKLELILYQEPGGHVTVDLEDMQQVLAAIRARLR
jgi:hypothetical protein